jgi:multidrug efflux pump
MKLPHFFIDRPNLRDGSFDRPSSSWASSRPFACRISEYPEVVPPSVIVSTQYPGANPKVIAETVASPLEQAINGVEHIALHVLAVDPPTAT